MLSSRILDNIIQRSLSEVNNDVLTEEEIDSLPRSDSTQICQCPICLDTIHNGDRIIKLECDHSFHERCITRWCNRHNNCPMCRRPIVQRDEQQQSRPISISISPIVLNPDITIFIKLWDDQEIETTWNPNVRILDIFEYISRLSICYPYKERLLMRFLGDGDRMLIFKTTESYGSLEKRLLDFRVFPIMLIHIEYF